MKKLLRCAIALLIILIIMGAVPTLASASSEMKPDEIYTEGGIQYRRLGMGNSCTVYSYVGDAEEVIIPSRFMDLPVVKIEDRAFNGRNVKSVKISQGVQAIGDDAFSHCDNLAYVEIPDSVTQIGGGAFAYCPLLTEIKLPEGLTTLKDGLFEQSKKLERIILPDGITEIEKYAFMGCEGLVEVKLPKSLRIIGKYAFSDCKSLKAVTLPDGLATLEEFAFRDTPLAEIHIPASVTSIGKNVFVYCRDLGSVTVDPQNSVYCSIDNCLIDKTRKSIVIGANGAIIPSDPEIVTKIDESAFYGRTVMANTNIVYVSTSSSSPLVYVSTSSSSPLMKGLWIPENITEIGNSAFSESTGFEMVRLRAGITKMGSSVFSRCESLVEAEIGCGLGVGMFMGCTNLERVEIDEGVQTMIDQYTFSQCEKLTEIVIPKSIYSINQDAFISSKKMKIVYISSEEVIRNLGGSAIIIESFFARPEIICIEQSINDLPSGIMKKYPNTSVAVRNGVIYNVFYKHSHQHVFDRHVVHEMYLKPGAVSAISEYYYSCICGEKGETTFAIPGGNPIPVPPEIAETVEASLTIDVSEFIDMLETTETAESNGVTESTDNAQTSDIDVTETLPTTETEENVSEPEETEQDGKNKIDGYRVLTVILFIVLFIAIIVLIAAVGLLILANRRT